MKTYMYFQLGRTLPVACVLLAMCVSSRAQACLWDRDTLGDEARGMPGVAEVIVGYYDRNPDLYYQMRIDRLKPKIDDGTATLEEYDDVAVAYDRLGDAQAAIELMTLKRAVLDETQVNDPEHEYRYLANLGTFYAHKWVRQDAEAREIADLKQAAELIERAIELNPDAHFGREYVQLRVLRALVDTQTIDVGRLEGYPYEFAIGQLVTEQRDDPEIEQTIKGYLGLITLGQASKSIDVHAALAALLGLRQDASLEELVLMRIEELHDQGYRSLLAPEAQYADIKKAIWSVSRAGGLSHGGQPISDYFSIASQDAADAHHERTTYMLALLERGEHPDTHTDFWKAYTAPEPVTIPGQGRRLKMFVYSIGILLGLIGAGVMFYFVKRSRSVARMPATSLQG